MILIVKNPEVNFYTIEFKTHFANNCFSLKKKEEEILCILSDSSLSITTTRSFCSTIILVHYEHLFFKNITEKPFKS